MKTRVLSILLLLAMLVGLVPATVVSGSETPDTELPKSETFTSVDDAYGIYVTDGLVAFFDANTMDAVDETVDFEEGKWVAKVYDKNTKTFVLSDDYFATITGGAFDATENPTGWKTDASGIGVGFDDPMYDAPDNLLSFGTALVAGEGVNILGADKAVDLLAAYSGGRYVPFEAWTVDTLTRINLRETPMQYDLYVENGGEGTYPLAVEDRGDTVVYTANRTGASVFTTSQTCPTTIVGEPGAKVTVTFICGRHPDGSQVSVTLNDEGRATISNYYYYGNKDLGGSLAVVVPAGVTVESIKLPFVIDENTASVDGGLYFGTLSGNFWTSKNAFSLSGDGQGKVRWCISDNGWAGRGGDAAWEMVCAPGNTNIWANDEGFVTDNGKLVPLYVTKTSATTDAGKAVSYDLLHGTSHRTGTQVPHTYGDRALQFKSIPGYVYSYRVYNRVLNELERAQNATADMMLRLGVDIELFNTMSDEAKEAFYPTAAALPETATKEEVETLIEETVEYIESLGVAKQLTEYEKLYVGYDGNGGFTAETANGGKLTSLFTAYAGDVSVNLSQGVWINKIADHNAILGNKQYWTTDIDGGVGVTQTYGTFDEAGNFTEEFNTYSNNGVLGTRLELGLAQLPKGDYSIEYVANYGYVMGTDKQGNIIDRVPEGKTPKTDESGGYLSQYGPNRYCPVDQFGNFISISMQRDYNNNANNWRTYGAPGGVLFLVWAHSNGLSENHIWNQAKEGESSLYNPGLTGEIFYTRGETTTFEVARRKDSDTVATFSLYKNASLYKSYTTNKYEYKYEYEQDETMRTFYLGERMTVDFYAVRIYDKTLTEAEKEQNHFADVMAYAQVDITEYNALEDPNDQKIIRGWLRAQPFTDDTEALQATLDQLIDSLVTAPTAEDSLYVTDGLRVLTTAYKKFNTGVFRVGDDVLSWFNGAVIGESVSVKGSGWQQQVDGGLKIKRSYEEWQADKNFGLYLTPDMLPDGDYTVEMITNPAGITVDQPDGTVRRYLDDHTTWGTYNTHAFAIGPLRCINFVCDSLNPPTQAGMERRWVYRIGNLCWSGNGDGDGDGDGPDSTSPKLTERTWMEVGVNDIINYRIVKDHNEEEKVSSTYSFYTNGKSGGSFVIDAAGQISNETANNMFQLMVGMPNTVYAVRVYDRLLTEVEYAQNYAADILYFYGLDVELFRATMELFPENPMLLYNLIGKMGFTLTKEEAAREFEGCLAGLWLEFKHSGVRNDKQNGMRFYFDFNQVSAESVVEKGYALEVGMLANIGSGVTPTLAGYNYDYKVVVYDSDMGKIDGFFIDEDTVALTILAESANKEAMLAGINVVGYVKLVAANGEETIYYATTSALKYELENLFTAYNHMVGLDKIKTQSDLLAYYQNAMADCYDEKFVYLDAAAPNGGNGSKDAPYNTFPAAFEDSMAKLKGINSPTRFYLMAADGEYLISDMMVMTEEDNPYAYSEFFITASGENTRLTSARTIDTNGFRLAGDNLYIYQFDADANGEYPNFRCLYVNNALALTAYQGSQFIEDFSQPRYKTAFNRYDDGPYITASYMAESGKLTLDYNPYPAEKVALRSRFVYYRDQLVAIAEVKKMLEASRNRELDGENNRYMLGLDAECPVENPSHIYKETFEKALLHYVACGEIFNLVAYGPVGGKRIPKSQFATQETLIEGASEAYKAKFRELAKAFSKGSASGFKIDEYTIEVECVVTTAQSKAATNNKAPLDTSFSSGMYKQATNDYNAGTMTYDSRLACDAMYDAVIWGLQYEYYRDALLALKDVLALKEAGTLTMASMPNEAGSAQYAALFTSYKYEMLAVAELLAAIAELEKDEVKAPAWKVLFASVETKVENAPAEYVAIFNSLREAHVLNNYATLTAAYTPKVKEADAPYGGNVPTVDPREEAKLYIQKELLGDLSRAIEDGKKALAGTAQDILDTALAVYQPEYERLLAAEQKVIDLTKQIEDKETAIARTKDEATKKQLKKELKALEGEKIAAEKLLPAIRKTVVAAKAEYDAQVAYAAELLDPETMDRYSLMHSGLEYQIIVEWSFNICPVWGVDYSDTITKQLLKRDQNNTPTGGYSGETEEYVAVYMDRDVYKGLAICTREYYWYPGDQDAAMGRMHWLANLDGFIDTQGEFYYDTMAGKIYYYSETGVEGLSFAYPQLDNMFVLDGAKNVTIEKLEITGMDSLQTSEIGFAGSQAAGYKNIDCLGNETHFLSRAPIYGYMGNDITIRDCYIHDVPGEGISLHGRQDNILIEGNKLTNIGSSAIRIATSPQGNTSMTESYGTVDSTITNNLVDGTGVIYRNAPAVTVACSLNMSITHNTILHSAYSAISIGWVWAPSSVSYKDPTVNTEGAEIAYNYITHFMTELADGGAIYTLGGNALLSETELFNKEHDNFIVFSNITGDAEKHFYAGIYHDGAASHWDTYRNVVVAQSYGAVKSENRYDSDPEKKEYLARLRTRYSRAEFFFAQTGTGMQTMNILFRDNYFVGTRATESSSKTLEEARITEAFKARLRPEFNVVQENTRWVKNPSMMPAAAENIAYASGCEMRPGDPTTLYGNDY